MACVMQVQLRPVHRGENVSIRRAAARGSGRGGERNGSAVRRDLRHLVQPLRPLHETRPAAANGRRTPFCAASPNARIPPTELETGRGATSTGSHRARIHPYSPKRGPPSRTYAPRSLNFLHTPHPPAASAGRSVLTHVLFPQLAQPDLAGEGGPRMPPDDGKSRHSALASFDMIYASCAHPSRAMLARGAGRPVRIRARRAV